MTTKQTLKTEQRTNRQAIGRKRILIIGSIILVCPVFAWIALTSTSALLRNPLEKDARPYAEAIRRAGGSLACEQKGRGFGTGPNRYAAYYFVPENTVTETIISDPARAQGYTLLPDTGYDTYAPKDAGELPAKPWTDLKALHNNKELIVNQTSDPNYPPVCDGMTERFSAEAPAGKRLLFISIIEY